MADGEDAPASLSKMDVDDPSSGLGTDATPGASATNPYETDPDKIPKHDPYLLARGPHYGRYFPRADDFTPRYNYWYQSEPESISYWREVVGKYCTPENSLGGYGSGTTADREAFAAGSVIIRVDQESADGPAAEKYSLLNANELCAARKAEEVLRDVDVSVPIIYFCGTIEGKNVTVESRIPGVSLEVAWRYLSAEQRASFKQQCRQILQRLGTAGSSADGPSYVCRGLNSQLQPDVQRLERDILFSEKGEDEDLCLVHNDMVRSNIIINNNRIVGILGWRRSGYFGHKRAAAVHRQLRTPERTYITGEGEDPGVEHAWADLYDSQEFEATKESAMTNGHDTTGPKVKTEPSVTSLDKVPASVAAEGARPPYISDLDGTDLPDDHPTPKKINDLKRGSVSRASSSERSSPAAPTKPGATTRRSAAATKKGTATKKPAAKRRKLNAQDGDTEGRRSNTPSSSRASKTPASRKQGSVSVAGSPPPDDKKNANDAGADEAEDEDYEGEEVFCICRKPDNHTWMIGCDGGCEDWFHGKCVNIDPRDADLIDKYICPNCQKEGKGSTTWKPMCRLKGCRRPARISKKFQSKYCSDEHGREFMRQKTAHLNLVSNSTAGKTGTGGRARGAAKGRRQDSHSVEGDAEESHNDDGGASNDDEEDDENDFQAQARRDREELGSRGGVLTAGELKAAVDGVSSAEEFRRLGEYIVSPPPEETGSGKKLGLDYDVKDLTYSPDEATKIQKLREQRDELLHRREMLHARNTFLSLVRQRAKNVLERLKQVDPKGGWKDICGFDSRLSWCDEEFDEWRLSEAGSKILKDGNPDALAEIHPQEGSTDADGDTVMMDGANNNNNNEDNNIEAIARGVCVKKRCERHKQWLKVQQQDILFEQSLVSQGLAKCEREAKAVVERAVLRMWAEQDAAA